MLKAGEILVTKSSGSERHLGKAALVDIFVEQMECCFSNFMQRLRCSGELGPKFVFYFLNNQVGRQQLGYLSSTTTGLRNLTASIIGSIRVAIPSRIKQREIVAFLDRETAKIDALISKQEELIEHIEDKLRAIVSNATIRGVDTKAPMRETKSPWLSNVPAHWRVAPLKYGSSVINCKHVIPTYVDEGVPLVSTTEVKPFSFNINGPRRVTLLDFEVMSDGGRRPTVGDIIYSRNASVGSAALVETGPF